MTPDPIFVAANYAEAGLWTVLAGVVAWRVRSATGRLLAIALLAFGVSDVVETRTGAWYDPWWLLAWKAACVVAIVAAGVALRRRRKR